MELAEKFYLAALCHSIGRRQALQTLEAGVAPSRALAAVDGAWHDPGLIARLCSRHGIELLTLDDSCYPPLLRVIPDPPPVLYLQGQLGALEGPTVAIVGARRCTRLGAEVTAALAGELARGGAAIVSGLARGIDTVAHRAALQQGRTVAVLGNGLVHPYPPSNRGLVRAILDGGGLLVSEYPPLAHPRRHHFPERNRLISGLSLGVVVVEAGEHSGSLITARMALEQGREVLAVPGPVTSPASRGCHRLLRQGAALVESAADVLEALGMQPSSQPQPGAVAAAERSSGGADPLSSAPADPSLLRVLDAVVGGSVVTLDEIVAVTGAPAAAASASLVELELGGFVRQVPGGYIRRPSRGF